MQQEISNELKDKMQKIKDLVGQTSNRFDSQITDIFIVPNEWWEAEQVFEWRRHGAGYLFPENPKMTFVAVLNFEKIVPISEIITDKEFTHLLAVISDLPDMHIMKKIRRQFNVFKLP